MQWWNNFVNWLLSDDGWRVFSTAILPFIAILVAGVIAALIGRRSAERVLAFQDRELKASAVAALIGAGRKAAVWSSLTVQEQSHYDNQISESDARVRLLPVSGSTLAGDWAAHQLSEMKKNSAIFSFQAEQTLDEFRDRLIEWQHKPSRAKKLFKQDLEQWKYAQPSPEQELSVQQQEWAASTRAAEVAAAALPVDRRTSASATAEPRDITPAVPPVTVASSAPTAETPAPLAPAITPQPALTESVPSPVEPKPYATSDLDSYSPPVTASTVRQRINPSTDD
ncbi:MULTISPECIES: hypothetical protein [unclassified Salinibacterium]|uniref:hypothetical protein n=1 Tax=unclassified Salinibacterium TaxID=2632331 RepID=UPI00174A9CB9|nr:MULTISPECIES: hypothetical protein [unclassified Salinibacterium]